MKSLTLLLSFSLLMPALHAQPVSPETSGATQSESAMPTRSAAADWEIGVEVGGFAVASFITEPKEADKTARILNVPVRVPYSGFGGVGGGGGLTINALWRDFVGLQIGIWNAQESAQSNLDIIDYRPGGSANSRYELTANKSAWHIPVALKLAIPFSTVRPHLLIGFDFVFPSSAEIDTTLQNTAADDRSYSALHFGLGFDFLLPIKDVDIRIPLVLRGNYNSGLGTKVEDRMSFDNCSLNMGATACDYEYRTDWQFQAFISLGIAYYFL